MARAMTAVGLLAGAAGAHEVSLHAVAVLLCVVGLLVAVWSSLTEGRAAVSSSATPTLELFLCEVVAPT